MGDDVLEATGLLLNKFTISLAFWVENIHADVDSCFCHLVITPARPSQDFSPQHQCHKAAA